MIKRKYLFRKTFEETIVQVEISEYEKNKHQYFLKNTETNSLNRIQMFSHENNRNPNIYLKILKVIFSSYLKNISTRKS